MSDTPSTDNLSRGNHVVPTEFACDLERECNAMKRAIELIAEDCEAWLASECQDPSAEFIKLVAKYAREVLQ